MQENVPEEEVVELAEEELSNVAGGCGGGHPVHGNWKPECGGSHYQKYRHYLHDDCCANCKFFRANDADYKDGPGTCSADIKW